MLAANYMARLEIDTRPIRGLTADNDLVGMAVTTFSETRRQAPEFPITSGRMTDFIFVRFIGHPRREFNILFLHCQRRRWASLGTDEADCFELRVVSAHSANFAVDFFKEQNLRFGLTGHRIDPLITN